MPQNTSQIFLQLSYIFLFLMKHATQATITQLNFFKNNLHFFWWYAKGDYICKKENYE